MKLFQAMLLMMALSGCYVTRQAYHHQQLYFSKRPISEVLEDPLTPPKTRTSLELSRKVMTFATAEGLKTKGAYQEYIATAKPVVSYIVQAAYEDHLELKTWWFPIVGSVPYLGYFEAPERDEKAVELKNEGFDVTTGGVGAFSTLGWFNDPIFSSMVARSHPELANLLLHELIHRTFWLPNSTEFNENLAEYCAEILTEKFYLQEGYGADLENYRRKMRDKKIFRLWLWELRETLMNLYEAEPRPTKQKILISKNQIFQTFLNPPKRPHFETIDYIGSELWNNATVLAEALYAPDTDKFAKAHACLGQDKPIREFLDAIKKSVKGTRVDNPFVGLQRLCDH